MAADICRHEKIVNGWVCVCFLWPGHACPHGYMMDRPAEGYTYDGNADLQAALKQMEG